MSADAESKLSLLSLPNEILILVFSHLEDPYPLYPLSTLCRRLHFLALPIYFSRTGVCQCDSESSNASCNIAVGGENTSTLGALQTSLFLGAVQNLCCTFSNPHSQSKDLARFRGLCSILSSIESTNLEFSTPSHDDYLDGAQTTYYDDVVRVLNAVLEKSCTTLTIATIPTDSIPAISRILRRARLHTRGTRQHPAMGVSTSSISLSPAAFRQKTLSTFRLHSEILFSPHCRAWTIDVLNSFPLASVSIDAPTVSTDVLDALLSVTEIPTLRDLSILNCRIKPSRMHLFLSRHPTITRLHLDSVFVPSLEERLPPGHLPQLRALSAPAAQLSYLLQAMEQTAALRTVRVLTHMTRLDLIFADKSLRSVTSRLAPVSLTLVLPVPPNLPRIAVDPDLHFGSDTALNLVTALEFAFPEETDSVAFKTSTYVVFITKWCDPFPGLTTVELSGFNRGEDTSLILEAIRTHAPNVEKLVVNGVEYDLAGTRGRAS
ncbi:hypothetical protein B0H13DRAFT_1970404 [Mycena leptocephala]|nr:hypothetical protein B0H13DRAFT_1970404 [Mycena leptocephala]